VTAIIIFGLVLLVAVGGLLLSKASWRDRTKPRDHGASESIAVWTSSSEQDRDQRRREP
jgi:hypothetical protein